MQHLAAVPGAMLTFGSAGATFSTLTGAVLPPEGVRNGMEASETRCELMLRVPKTFELKSVGRRRCVGVHKSSFR